MKLGVDLQLIFLNIWGPNLTFTFNSRENRNCATQLNSRIKFKFKTEGIQSIQLPLNHHLFSVVMIQNEVLHVYFESKFIK